MSNPQIISAIVVLVGVIVGLLLRYYKGGIGEKKSADINIAEGHLNIARGTVELVTSTTEEFTRLAHEMAEQRRELEALGATCSTLRQEVNGLQHRLEGVTRERDELLVANKALSGRVDAQDEEIKNLKQRVKDLQQRRGPQGERGKEGPAGPAGS